MEFKEAAISFLKRWNDFEGRSSRSEYWWAYLATMLAFFAAAVVAGIVYAILRPVGGLLYAIIVLAALAQIVPSLAISFRRLHDTEKSAWWMLIGFIPLGGIVLLVFFVTAGTKGSNNFGPDPLGSSGEVFA